MATLGRPLAMRRNICASCVNSWSGARLGLQNSDRIQRRYKYYIAPAGEQARPITGFYAGKIVYDVLTCAALTVHRDTEEGSITGSNNFGRCVE